jgi:hypothetical protein
LGPGHYEIRKINTTLGPTIREKLNEKKIVSTLGPGQYDP